MLSNRFIAIAPYGKLFNIKVDLTNHILSQAVESFHCPSLLHSVGYRTSSFSKPTHSVSQHALYSQDGLKIPSFSVYVGVDNCYSGTLLSWCKNNISVKVHWFLCLLGIVSNSIVSWLLMEVPPYLKSYYDLRWHVCVGFQIPVSVHAVEKYVAPPGVSHPVLHWP